MEVNKYDLYVHYLFSLTFVFNKLCWNITFFSCYFYVYFALFTSLMITYIDGSKFLCYIINTVLLANTIMFHYNTKIVDNTLKAYKHSYIWKRSVQYEWGNVPHTRNNLSRRSHAIQEENWFLIILRS